MLGFTPTKDELDEIIEVVDQDGSGEIDFDEFLIMMVMQLKEESKSQDETVLKEAFRILDTYVEKLLINIVNICGVIAILVILRDLKSENN
jgi:Ca2+-binding EF-hand superfamily protein